MDSTVGPPARDAQQRCLDGVQRLVARSPTHAGATGERFAPLLDALSELLGLSFASLRLPDIGPAWHGDEPGPDLAAVFGDDPADWPATGKVRVGASEHVFACTRFDTAAGAGVLVAGAERDGFPTALERILLEVAASQARLAWLQARRADAAGEPQASAIELRRIVDTVPGLVALLTAGGEVDAVNHRIVEYCGQPLEAMKSWGTNGIVHPDDMPLSARIFMAHMESGEPYEWECRIRRHDGVYRWFQNRGHPWRDGGGNVVRWYVLLTDIEDLKQAEVALRASERESRLLIDTLPALAWSTDADGRADFFNQHYLDFCGIARDQATGWGWTAAVHPDDLPGVLREWHDLIARGLPGEAEVRMRRQDGEFRSLLVRVNPLRDDAGRIRRWYGVNIDVTASRQAEAALNRVHSELARMTRVSALDELAASIAHEVSQPLTGIIANSGACLHLLDADPPDIAGARATVHRTLRDGHRAANVIARLQALHSRRDLSRKRMDMNEAVREVAAMCASDLKQRRITLHLELDAALPAMVGDRMQLQQVILDVLRHAADAVGVVEGRTRDVVIRTVREPEGGVRVSVRDVGARFDPAAAGGPFEALRTARDGGVGQGLSAARAIVGQHGGRLRAEAAAGGGAIYEFVIPASAGDA